MAKEKGMTVIVTDHHEIPYREENGERRVILPPADAILNPKQYDCLYPNKNLCGAFVAFKYITALYERFDIQKKELEDYYELVAIATVGDVMDLQGEISQTRICADKRRKMCKRQWKIHRKLFHV